MSVNLTTTGLPSFWDREQAYRRRLLFILPFVLVALLITFFVSGQPGYERVTRFVGWRGPMELLPEITIEPDVATAEAVAAPAGVSAPERVVVETSQSETTGLDADIPIPDAQPARQVNAGEGTLGVSNPSTTAGQATTESRERPGQAAVSYSSEYVILRMVKPHYPERERAEGIEGNVTVELLIGVDGTVLESNVLNVVGPPGFESATLDAVRNFLFQPPIIDGRPSEMWIKFVVKFRINS